jgi:hypothetical protein
MRIRLDKIASSTRNVKLPQEARISSEIIAAPGYIVAGRLHGEKGTYNQLEDVYGRMVPLHAGDVVAGVLGPRNALLGYAGVVPDEIEVGDRLHVLNLGGVIGKCTSGSPELGPPFDFEVLGSVLVFPDFENRKGTPAHIGMNALGAATSFAGRNPITGEVDGGRVPIVYIAGTCMNSGKTSTACKLIRAFTQRGLVVGGCKLTGVSLLRDALQMRDHGARHAYTFNDAGVVTTSPETAVDSAKTILAHLGECGVDVIVAELGDGIAGEYGVQEILADSDLMSRTGAFVLCANDPVGAWGAQKMLQDLWGIEIDVVCGPATDNVVGTRYIERTLGCTALNARTHAAALGEFLWNHLETELRLRQTA